MGTLLPDQRLVDMRNDTSASDGRLDQTVQLLVTPDGQLQVTRRDTLHLQILGRVTGQLENLTNNRRPGVSFSLSFGFPPTALAPLAPIKHGRHCY